MTKVALLIGVSEYASGLKPLPSAVEDVDALYRVLVDPERGDFLAEKIQVLKDPPRQEMEEAIYWLFNNRQKDDLLLFYFSGHGIKDDGNNLYLGTRITQKDDRGSLIPPSAVAATYLHDRIESSRSQRQVIILDSCFSGAIAQGMTVKDDGTVRLEDYLGGKGRAILTSSTATEYSFGAEPTDRGSTGLSIYTRYLVEGIATGAADLDGDDWISVDELHEYASKKVKQAAPAMTPKFYPVEEGYKILLAKSQSNDPQVKYEREVQSRAEQGQGEFSIVVRRMLLRKQQEWGISPEEARAIEDRVLQPYREYQAKLVEYEQTLTEAVQAEYPISDRVQAELKEYQQYLKLQDEDVSEIHQRVRYIPPDRPTTPVNHPPSTPPSKPPVQPVTPKSPVNNSPRTPPSKPPVEPAKTQVSPEVYRRNFIKLVGFGGSGVLLAFVLPKIFTPDRQPEPTPSSKPSNSTPLLQASRKPSTRSLPPLSTIQFVSVKLNDKGTIIDRPKGQAQIYKEDLGNAINLTMVKIPAGEFLMGSPTSEAGRRDDESPQHKVRVPEFYLGQTVVTQEQWQQIMGNNPSHFTRNGKLPVEQVSWRDAQEFCQKLSQYTQRKYRLPSEAEWEYACRAGTKTPFHFGETITTDVANFNGNEIYGNAPKGKYLQKTTPVGFYKVANNFGLYDMHGNVWEWCEDTWHENYQGAPTDGTAWLSSDDNSRRLLRGGSWDDLPRYCRSAFRFSYFPGNRNDNIGFRVACAAPRLL